jgi:hypothetical protein
MAPARSRKKVEWLQFGSGKSYFHRVHRPLQCLVFIAPLLVFYQIASVIHPPELAGVNWQVLVAFNLMLDFFNLFGAAANVLPPLAVIAILLSWHLARKDPWDFDPPLYAGMAAESILWGIPFVIIGMALQNPHPIIGGTASEPTPWNSIVLSVGAGVYEELLFRLIAINLLSILLMDLFELKASLGIPLIIFSSALLFSAYHLLGNEPFDAGRFAFRAAVGVYLAGIYIYRGFGIVVGAHTVYDLIVAVLLPMLHHS